MWVQCMLYVICHFRHLNDWILPFHLTKENTIVHPVTKKMVPIDWYKWHLRKLHYALWWIVCTFVLAWSVKRCMFFFRERIVNVIQRREVEVCSFTCRKPVYGTTECVEKETKHAQNLFYILRRDEIEFPVNKLSTRIFPWKRSM